MKKFPEVFINGKLISLVFVVLQCLLITFSLLFFTLTYLVEKKKKQEMETDALNRHLQIIWKKQSESVEKIVGLKFTHLWRYVIGNAFMLCQMCLSRQRKVYCQGATNLTAWWAVRKETEKASKFVLVNYCVFHLVKERAGKEKMVLVYDLVCLCISFFFLSLLSYVIKTISWNESWRE